MRLTNGHVAEFMFAGNALFTLVSTKTGTRFTYKIQKKADGPFFVKVLTGPDNTADYRYAGFIPANGQPTGVIRGRNGMDPKAPSMTALNWYLSHPDTDKVEVYHEGRCGRCGRTLTVPESIERGIGPDCAEKM